MTDINKTLQVLALIGSVQARLAEVQREVDQLYVVARELVGGLTAEQVRQLRALVNDAVSTRAIVMDSEASHKFGHNPSWVKAYDVRTILDNLGE